VTSFTRRQNPLILSNPRRRRRRNPSLNIKQLAKNTAIYFGGGAVGYAINQFGLSQIQNDWVRRGSQIVLATVGGAWLKGSFGAAFAGATMYPLIADLAMYTGLVAVPTADELDELSADLSAALEADLGDDELYIDDFEPMYNESLVDW